jgi:membrane protease YdiL (CAAX protease family)
LKIEADLTDRTPSRKLGASWKIALPRLKVLRGKTMTTAPNVLPILPEKNTSKVFRWQFAQTHPVLAYLLITFAWTWLFWLAVIPLRGGNDLLLMLIVLIGGYGPAIGGILTLGLKNGMSLALSQQQLQVLMTTAATILGLMIVRYWVGIIPGYDRLPENLTLSGPIVVAALGVCLVGGWVIANARSSNIDVREKMASLLPVHLPWRWTLFALFFFPVLLLLSWGIGTALGQSIEYPALWARSLVEVIPLFLLAFTLTALARGGMEEPGWRGLLQPALQNTFSPLLASLIVALFWSLWHLPLFLNGFYPEPLVTGMVGGGIYRILLATFLTWFYNRSGGNLLLLVILHTSFNVMVNYLPLAESVLTVLWLLVAVAVVVKDKMYRTLPSLVQG